MAGSLFSKDTMTNQERMTAVIQGRIPDRVPFNPFASGFAARLYGIDRGAYYRNPEKAFAAGLAMVEAYPWMNARPSYGWADRGTWEFGGQMIWPDEDRYIAPVATIPVITRPEEVEDLPDPDPKTAGMMPLVDRFNEISRQAGFPASLPGGTAMTLTAGVVGRTNYLRWMMKHPEALHRIQRKVTDFLLRSARLTIDKFGAENCGVMAGVPMESNQLISARAFAEFSKPYIQEILGFYISAGVKNVMVHLCGDHTLNLPHWQDIPLPPRTVFSIGFEMDLEKTSQALGPDYVLAGNMNNTIIQIGSPEDVRAEVGRCLATGMKHPGGFILMPACEFPPDTPLENLEAIAGAINDFGYY